MAKATTNETVFISIERPVKGSLTLRIVGDSPLIVHAWSEKAKKEMLQAQLRTQMLEDARRDAQTFRQKYNTLEAIAPIITGIDAVFGEEDVPCVPQ